MNFFSFFLASSISVLLLFFPVFGSALQCKLGRATYLEEVTSPGPCPNVSDEYCIAFTCRKAGTSVIYTLWGCMQTNDKAWCDNEAKVITEGITKKTGISCDCQFGEKGKEMDNQQFVLPPMAPIVEPVTGIKALKKRLVCKIGVFRENGQGQIHIGFCGADAKYCYAASCKIGSGVIDAWGCQPSNDYCSKVGKLCHFCKLGKKDEKHSNINFMIPTFLKKSTASKTISTPSANLVTDISDEMSETTVDENVSIRATIPTVSIAFAILAVLFIANLN